MSIEIVLVFALSTPPSAVDLQSAFNSQGLPATLDQSLNLAELHGFLPLTYRGKATGFEYSAGTVEAFLKDYPGANVAGLKGQHAVTFRWGASLLECAAALDAAAALADGLGAKVFSTESGEYAPAEFLRAGAKQCFSLAEEGGAPGKHP